MPVSSSSGLDIDLVFTNAAAATSSSSSSSSLHPWIPPRSQWPLPGEDDAAAGEGDEGDDGQDDWGPSTSAPKSRWLTAMTSWSSRREGSGGCDARMAIATADGSVHFFAQEHQRASSPSKSPIRASARSPSPTPSIASTRSGFHPRADSHAPPFAGFASHEGTSTTQEHILSPTSPTSTNLASTAAWKPSSPEGSRQQGFDALESRLESQYHSGSAAMSAGSSATHGHHRGESVVGSFMESLGLSKSTGHPHHHGHHISPSRSRRDSSTASASASAEMSRTSSSSRTTGPMTSSNTQLTPPPAAASPSSSRRHSHARSSAIIGSSSAMASLHAPSSGGAEEMKRSRSVSQATAGSNSRRREDVADSPSANQSPAAPAILEKVRPYARLSPNGRDGSQVVAMATCRLSGDSKDGSQPDTLLVLHRSGWMTAVSLHDGTVLGDIDLASASPSTPAEQAPASAASGLSTSSASASASGGGNGGGGGGGLVASTLAALRSHSNSPGPAPSGGPAHARLQQQQQQQQQQQPTSRPGSASLLRRALTNETGPTFSAASGSQAVARPPPQQQQQGKQRSASFTSTLRVIQSAESGPVAVCFDTAQKLLVFVALHAAPGHAASLRVVEAVHLPEASRERALSIVVGHEVAESCLAHLDEARQAVMMQKYEFKNGTAVVKVSSSKLAVPDSLTGSVQSCALLDSKRMLLRTVDETVLLLKIADGEDRLEVVKSLRVAGLEEAEVVAALGGVVEHALARCKGSTRLLRISDDDVALLQHEGGVDVATSLLCGPYPTLLTASASEAGLQITSLDSTASTPVLRQLYTSTSSTPAIQGLLPLSMERVLVLTSSGHLVMTTLNDLVTGGAQALSKTPDTPPCTAAAASNARLTMFRLIGNPTSQSSSHRPSSSSASAPNKYILTTFSTGSLAFWDPATLRLIAEWSLFTTPVAPHSLALFGNNDNTLRLHNCLALSSLDGSLALIALEGLKLLYLIPGRGKEAPLTRLAVRADELMLLYADGRARVWDVASMELRRSVSSEQAGGMLVDGRGSWSIFEMSGQDGGSGTAANQTQSGVLSAVQPSTAGVGVGMMRANLKRAIDAAYKAATNGSTATAAAAVKDGASTLPLPRPRAVRPSASSATIGSTSSASGGAARVQTILRPLMTALWPWGIDGEMDAAVRGLFDPPLQVSKSSTGPVVVGTGLSSSSVGEGGERRHNQILPGKEGDQLTVSGVTNATRFLALVAMLDVLSRARGTASKTRTEKEKDEGTTSIARLTAWLSATLPCSVPSFAPHNPAVLALHLVDPTPSIRSAATLLLEKRIQGMESQEVDALVEGQGSWRALLPSSAAAAGQRQTQAQSLSLVGFLCLKRYAALDPSLLRDVAESVAFSLSPTLTPDHSGQQQQQQQLRLIALHLCVQGFSIWQNYVDAMALLRALFALAVVNGEREDGEVQVAARQAVVQVAEEHAPLFMTTLNLDLLAAGAAGTDQGSNVATSSTSSASGAQQAMRTMRLLTFLVGQRPNLLVASLPRIAEAVVKALDPTISATPSANVAGSNSNASAASSPKSTTSLLPQPPGSTTTTQRDLLLPTATSLISSLVRTYRTLAFHGPTQRLAVGTHEGAIVMYELRSATRLFVLEGGHGHGQQHRAAGVGSGHHSGGHAATTAAAAGPLTMLSFSPDGRRLISLSLSEGKALAWKVGSSLASWLLRPGGVPRQGGGSTSIGGGNGGGTAGAEPAYKIWRFRPFVEAEEEADVRCEWVAEKRCEVEIAQGDGKGKEMGRRERTMWDVE